jgi:hypothetical protein
MDTGGRNPLLECFLRGDVPRDVRLLAARGAVAPSAHEQLALLVLLSADGDDEVATVARQTIDGLPPESLARFLARGDVSSDVRSFFAKRGVVAAGPPAASDTPLVEVSDDDPADATTLVVDEEADGGGGPTKPRPLSTLTVMQRIKLAMNGTREQRGVLIRDANRMVAAAVLSSPKLSETEIESFARMTNVSEEVLRVIATSRGWTKNYGVLAAIVKNPKTPPSVSMSLVPRLAERDVKQLATDRNVPEGIRLVARKLMAANESRRK